MQVLINIFLSTLITVDPFYNSNEGLKQFGVMVGAKPIEKSIEDFQEILW